MRSQSLSSFLTIAFLAFFATCSSQAGFAIDEPNTPQWRFGVYKTKITPEESMPMAGYASRTRGADGKMTELWAKAIALSTESQPPLLLITLDLVGIDRELSQTISARIQDELSIPAENIAINVSHTHSGPVVGFNLRPMHYALLGKQEQESVRTYSKTLADKIVKTAITAASTQQLGELKWGTGRADFAVNRRENRPESEVPSLRSRNKLAGPVDHDVPVLVAYDTNSKPMAIVFGYACHATVLSSYQWSGDYPGFAQIEIEARFPDCMAMFWAGCGGDQNPLPRRSQTLAQHYGNRLATAVETVVRTSELEPLEPTYRANSTTIPLAFDGLPSRGQIEQDCNSKNRYIASRAQFFKDKLDSGQKLSETYPYPIQWWNLGQSIDWIFLGGEVVVDYALKIKSARGDQRTWVAAYSNDVMAYIPSRRVWLEGGYEGAEAMVYYGLPSRWSEEIEQKILTSVATVPWHDSQLEGEEKDSEATNQD